MKSISCTMSPCRFAAWILEISFASDLRCCRPTRRSSRIWGSLFLGRTGLAILQIENVVTRLNVNHLLRQREHLAVQDRFDLGLQFLLNSARWTISVHSLKAVNLMHLIKLLLNLIMVLNETVVHVLGPIHIHARLPVIEHRVFPEITFNKYFRTYGNIENRIRYERNAIDLLYPVRFHAANDRASHECIDVAVGEHDKSSAQGRQNAVLELIGKISGVEQAQRACSQDVALHCFFEFSAHQAGALQTDIRRGIAATLEPVAKQVDMRRTARPIGSFNGDQQARE